MTQPIEGADAEHAMVTPDGLDMFYPDSIEDAIMFWRDHEAQPVHLDQFIQWVIREDWIRNN